MRKKNMVKRSRTYIKSKLSTWINKHCRICGHFVNKYNSSGRCNECNKAISHLVANEVIRYSIETIKEAISPMKFTVGLRKIITPYCRHSNYGE
jgi:uncharacterized protein with PIN domain